MSRSAVCILLLLLWSFPMLAQVNPSAENTDEQLAAQYFREGQYERAATLYEALFEKRPTDAIYNQYLRSLIELEEYRKAERLVRGQIRIHPARARYAVDLGWVLERSGNIRQARRHMDGLINGLEPDGQGVRDLALAFEQRDMIDRAIETYLQGRKLMGSAHPFNLLLASLYEHKGDYRSMMHEYVVYLENNLMESDVVMGILQDAISNDPNYARNDALREILLSRSQSNPSNTLYVELLLWLSIQQKDFRMAFMQARALDRRFREDGDRVLEVARLSTENQNYEVASQAYQYILDKGQDGVYYMEALTGYLDARFLSVTSSYSYSREDLLMVEQDYHKALDELGINAITVRLVRNLAKLQAFYLGNTDKGIELLNKTLEIRQLGHRVQAECRIELADILLLTGQVWDATLLYSQVDKTFRDDPLGHEARYKNARLSFYIGEFDWAKAQLDVLKAATSRLIANDAMKLSLRIQDNVGFDGNTEALKMFARAEKLTFMRLHEDALAVLDSMERLMPAHPILDDVLFAKAEIMLLNGQYRQADTLLEHLAEQFPGGLLADEAIMKRARLYEEIFQDKETAMSLYQKIMLDYPGSLNNLGARNRFRHLRGDLVN